MYQDNEIGLPLDIHNSPAPSNISPRKNGHKRSCAAIQDASEQAIDSELSDSSFPLRANLAKSLASTYSSSTLRGGKPVDAEVENGALENSLERVVIIRDFAFPHDNPRYQGLIPLPEAINIPGDASLRDGSETGSWYSSHSGAIISSSSSSSLDDNFVPPPFGSFGFGHTYHQPQQNFVMPSDQARRGRSSTRTQQGYGQKDNHNQSHGHDWTTWGRQTPSDDDFHTSHGGSGSGSSKYSWNFVTESGGSEEARGNDTTLLGGLRESPNGHSTSSDLLGSALSIENFEDSDDEEEAEDYRDSLPMDDEFDEVSSTEGIEDRSAIAREVPPGGLLYRAMYAFTPEAPQEMSLNEGNLVRVWEKLCDGWVVGGKVVVDHNGSEEETETGLIPQNYLVEVEDQKEQMKES